MKVELPESSGGTKSFDASHRATDSIDDPPHKLDPRSLSSTATGSLTSTKMTGKKIGIIAGSIVLLSATIYCGFQSMNGKKHPEATSSPAVVTVAAVLPQINEIDDTVGVTGSVSAWDPLSVGAEVSGLRIKAVNVEEGDRVKKGQVLAVLNSAVLQAQLAQARARLISSEANLKKSIQPNRQEEIHSMQAALEQAEANANQEEALRKEAQVNFANADLNAKRYAELLRTGAVSSQDAETRQVTADTSRAELLSSDAKIRAAHFMITQAKEKLLQAQRGGRVEDVAISRATIEETKGQIQQLSEQVDETIIRAPDDGLVSRRDAHIGDIAPVGTPLFSIIRLNKLELRAQVSDIDLAKFKAGQTVTIATNENDRGTITGKVKLVSPQVDPASRLGTVRIELPSDVGLKPGMFVRGEVQLGKRNALTVPLGCVVTRNGLSTLFTLVGDRAVSAPVKIGVQTDKFVEIIDGLNKGKEVICQGTRFLNDQDIVRVSK